MQPRGAGNLPEMLRDRFADGNRRAEATLVWQQASSDRECPMCLQRHLSNILKYF